MGSAGAQQWWKRSGRPLWLERLISGFSGFGVGVSQELGWVSQAVRNELPRVREALGPWGYESQM